LIIFFAFEQKVGTIHIVRNEWMEEVVICGISRGAQVGGDREQKPTNPAPPLLLPLKGYHLPRPEPPIGSACMTTCPYLSHRIVRRYITCRHFLWEHSHNFQGPFSTMRVLYYYFNFNINYQYLFFILELNFDNVKNFVIFN